MPPEDPPTTPDIQPIDPAVTQSYVDFTDAASKSEQSMSMLNGIFGAASSSLKSLGEAFVATGGKLENIGNLTSQDAAKFGILTTSIIGAKEAFQSFANVDTDRLSTFASQVGNLQNILEKSPAYGLAKKGFDEAAAAAKNLMQSGDSAKKSLGAEMLASATKAFDEAKNKILESAKAMLVSADNSLRFQNALFQLTAQAGDTEALFEGISGVFDGVGDDLSNLNNVTGKLQDVMYDAMQATGIESEEVMSKLMGTIMKMPGGLKELMGSMEIAGRSTNILTAAVQYATGAHRDQTQVLEDMKKAVSSYGTSLEDALKFTTNVSTVSKTLGAQIDDVRSALMGSADAFKFFAMGQDGAKKMTQGMTESMNQYVASLKSVGVPVQNALDMYKNYTAQIKDMNQAQQAFVSGMSGGPGGLMGGFQMDKMIKQGDFAGVQKKVEETIRKMTGPIVSFEEATKSQSAAAQYTRQIQILQQGPLGKQARTREEAEALLESMRSGKTAKPVKDATTALSEAVEQGAKMEQLSYTELKEINISTKRMAAQAGLANLTTLQRSFAARTGAGAANEEGRGINVENQELLRATQERGMAPSEASPTDKALKELGVTIKSLPVSVQSSVKGLKESLSGGKQESIAEAQARFNKSIEDWRAQTSKLPDDQKAQRESTERIISSLQSTAAKEVASSQAKTLFRLPEKEQPTALTDMNNELEKRKAADFKPAYKRVGAAVPTGTTAPGTTPTGTRAAPGVHAAGGNQPVPVTLAAGSGITVNFTGLCPHCGRDMHQSAQGNINSAPSMAPNK